MKAAELLDFLREFYRDKLTMRQRHVAAARQIGDYDFNNTYQYVIAREDVQVNWLRDAVTGMGGTLEEIPEPEIRVAGKGLEAQSSVIAADRDGAQAFVEKWRPRIEVMPNARQRSMLRVIVGETIEHKRFFDQALAGRTDLLGRRTAGGGTGGGVLPVRWMEQ